MTEQTYNPTPFHRGEVDIQSRYGVDIDAHDLGTRMMRNYLIDQHREFFSRLPFVMVGSVDKQDRPWASILVGGEGFIQSPDDQHLSIQASPLYADPLNENLSVGVDIGLLGIMLDNRRRNRMNGRVVEQTPNGFEVEVVQSFGNCPKYIQQRDIKVVDDGNTVNTLHTVLKGEVLSEEAQELIQHSDTLFIASQFSEDNGANNNGVDVSHRGGKPGFVRVDDDRTLTIPDFAGNNLFNTLGNLSLNPKAGLLFIDFVKRDLLYLTGTTEIIFSGEEVQSFSGAQRLLRFVVDEAIHVKGSLPIQSEFQQLSPFLKHTGEWS